MGGERTPSNTAPNLARKPASVRAKEGNDMFNWIKYGRGKRPPPMTRTPAGAMDEADCLPFGYNPPPDKPADPKWAAQALREKESERAAKGVDPRCSQCKGFGCVWCDKNMPSHPSNHKNTNPVPLSETEEYKDAVDANASAPHNEYHMWETTRDLLDLIKSRGL